ncbi:MFS transporter [Janibacter sp. GXQ6167]|uniref:MFS transporter n=1 Tax=Janibacter sp. GXQ6167 TaxID=3240791 RepID=UPI003523E52F
MSSSAAPFSWRAVALPAYGPTALAGAAMGAVLPVAAMRASELGASLQGAALIVAMLGVGQLLGAVPAGALVARLGERTTLIRMGVVDVIALAAAGFAPTLWIMGAAMFLSGLASSAYFLARQGWMIDALPPERLARGMSLLGGSLRLGMLIGPAVGAVAIAQAGLQGAYILAVGCALGSLIIVICTPDITAAHERRVKGEPVTSVFRVIRTHRSVLLTLGLGVTVISILRQARIVILPLWALHLGLGGVESSVIFAIAAVIELAVVYPSGWVMDHVGRTAVVLPLMVIMSLAMALLPLATEYRGLLAVATLMAVGNGLGSGIVMTLGADAAPAADRAQFLGGWRLCGEVGHAAAPLFITAVTAAASLAAAALGLALIGGIGAGWMTWWVARQDRARRAALGVR